MIQHWRNKSFDNLTEIYNNILYIEEWRYIKGYDGLYKVSSFGRVKSLQRVVSHKTSYKKTIPERILAISKDSQGYLLANLWKNNVCFHGLVHRLVAQAFIENQNNLPEVNHKFGNKEDNRYWMLNWSTASDNQIHSYEVLKRRGSSWGKFGADNKLSKKVRCTTLDVEFDSFSNAAKELAVHQSAISLVCTGRRVHTNGLTFKYI